MLVNQLPTYDPFESSRYLPDAMHGSSSATLRPRQRTFTSCTECRRRKQRCNQAKDRPCNNCSRRYPPVLCTYETSASPPPSHDRLLDLRDGHDQQSSTRNPRRVDLLTPQSALQYQQHPSRSADNIVAPTVQSTEHATTSTTYYASNSAPSSSYAYHSPSSSASRNEYRSASYTAGDVSATQYLPTSSGSGGFLSMGSSGGGSGGGGDDGDYFGTETVAFDDGHEFYGGGGGGGAGGVVVDATQGDWLSGVAHQNGFLGTDGLYYVYDVDGQLVRSTRS